MVDQNAKKRLVSDETWYLMDSELVNCDFQLTIHKIKSVDSIWQTKRKKGLNSSANCENLQTMFIGHSYRHNFDTQKNTILKISNRW